MYDNAHIFSKDAKYQSLIGNVQLIGAGSRPEPWDRKFQSLIGNVQLKLLN